MTWVHYVLAAALALGIGDILVKLAAGKIPNSLGMLLYGSVPFAVGLVWFFTERARGPVVIRPVPLLYGLGVGLSYTLVTFALYGAFRASAPLSIVSPVVRFGGLIVAAAAGLIMWREPLTPRYLIGFGMVIAGLALLLKR